MKVSVLLAACSSLLIANASAALDPASKIHPSVHRKLQQDGAINILVSFKNGPQIALDRVDVSNESRSHGDRVTAVVDSLEQHARDVQKELLALTTKYKTVEARAASGNNSSQMLVGETASLWLTNQVWVGNATPEFVKMISALDTVAAVLEDELVPFTEPNIDDEIKKAVIENENGNTGGYDSTARAVQWGVAKVRAPELWAKNITGEGVVVASIDTGVRATHVALKGSFRGEFGWYDAIAQKTEPYDDVGHGSHTLATMAGQLGYGVAPGAKWMACKACGKGGCLGSALVKCAQWITCPTSTTGARDCTKAPHIINSSWGGGKSLAYFSDAIDGWRKAGIIPIFSSGNSGSACSTVSSPADLDTVISVGATDRSDAVAPFSSKGPAGAFVKPDISAPGTLIRSALPADDNAYGFMSGTSMAAPHVAGVVALMLSQDKTLSFSDVLTLLRGNIQVAGLKDTGRNCGGISETVFPNNAYGAGRLDAVLVVQKIPSPSSFEQVAGRDATPAPATAEAGTSPLPAPVAGPAPTPTPASAPAPAPTPAPVPASTFQPFQQRLPRSADATLNDEDDVVAKAKAADVASLTGDFTSTSVSFRS